MHCQLPPKAQGKLVRVTQGEDLSEVNKKQLWIPEGFAHGFVTISETAEFLYKTTDYYALEFECCIQWSGPGIGID